MEVGQWHLALAPLAPQLHQGIECDQGHSQIGGMRRDAVLAAAQHRIPAVLAADRCAAGAGRSLVAGCVAGIAEVGAAGTLQQFAPIVAWFRTCGLAEFSSACAMTGNCAITMGCIATSAIV